MALQAQDLDTGADIPLLAEIRDNDVAGAREALDGGADPNAAGRKGYRPLHLAAAYGRPGIVRLLIDRGADPNAPADGGNTPIHYAAMACDSENFISAARALVDGGANPLIKDDHGWDAFNLAPPDDNQTAFAMRKFLRGAEKEWRGHRIDESAPAGRVRLREEPQSHLLASLLENAMVMGTAYADTDGPDGWKVYRFTKPSDFTMEMAAIFCDCLDTYLRQHVIGRREGLRRPGIKLAYVKDGEIRGPVAGAEMEEAVIVRDAHGLIGEAHGLGDLLTAEAEGYSVTEEDLTRKGGAIDILNGIAEEFVFKNGEHWDAHGNGDALDRVAGIPTDAGVQRRFAEAAKFPRFGDFMEAGRNQNSLRREGVAKLREVLVELQEMIINAANEDPKIYQLFRMRKKPEEKGSKDSKSLYVYGNEATEDDFDQAIKSIDFGLEWGRARPEEDPQLVLKISDHGRDNTNRYGDGTIYRYLPIGDVLKFSTGGKGRWRKWSMGSDERDEFEKRERALKNPNVEFMIEEPSLNAKVEEAIGILREIAGSYIRI